MTTTRKAIASEPPRTAHGLPSRASHLEGRHGLTQAEHIALRLMELRSHHGGTTPKQITLRRFSWEGDRP